MFQVQGCEITRSCTFFVFHTYFRLNICSDRSRISSYLFFTPMKEKTEDIRYIILATLGIFGIIFISITAPNILQIFGMYSNYKKVRRQNFKRSLVRLKERKLIIMNNKSIEITRLGLDELGKYNLKNIKIKSKIRDGKTRLLMFDIPVQLNKRRGLLTKKLKEIGFSCVQKSVWEINYDCEKEVFEILSILKLEKFVRFIIY